MNRKLIHRTTLKECRVDTFRAGGKGGQNQNKRDTGVRIVHLPSGAVGESREFRTQLENKRSAFRKMGESKTYQAWARQIAFQFRPIDDVVDEMMKEENLKIEYF